MVAFSNMCNILCVCLKTSVYRYVQLCSAVALGFDRPHTGRRRERLSPEVGQAGQRRARVPEGTHSSRCVDSEWLGRLKPSAPDGTLTISYP